MATKKAPFRLPTKAQLKKYLETTNRKKFEQSDVCKCPVASYIKDTHNIPDQCIGVPVQVNVHYDSADVRIGDNVVHYVQVPNWISDYIEVFDAGPSGYREDALAALDRRIEESGDFSNFSRNLVEKDGTIIKENV